MRRKVNLPKMGQNMHHDREIILKLYFSGKSNVTETLGKAISRLIPLNNFVTGKVDVCNWISSKISHF